MFVFLEGTVILNLFIFEYDSMLYSIQTMFYYVSNIKGLNSELCLCKSSLYKVQGTDSNINSDSCQQIVYLLYA